MGNTYICGSDRFFYGAGYLALSVDVGNLPDTFVVEGQQLQKKSSFHVSLLCIKSLPGVNAELEKKTLDFFCTFVQENMVSFVRYTGEFRYAQYEERKSVIALCEVSNLARFFKELGKELGIEIPPQPTHVTLYTLQPEIGIGLNTRAEMDEKSLPIEPPEEIKAALEL